MSTTQPSSTGEVMIALLRSIDARLKIIADGVQARTPKAAASDRDLDGKYGNPKVRTMPRDWTGVNYKGRRYSECPPELLDLIAEMHDYFAQKADEQGKTHNGKPTAPYERADAARARGWAGRIRDGKAPQSAQPLADFETGDDDRFGGDDDAAGFGGDGFE